jgi:prevent-host-death family protein
VVAVLTVGSYEAKTRLAELLKRVEEGERVTITRHGLPVAVLVPAGQFPRKDVAGVIAELKEFRQANDLGGLTVRELIEEGRRW